MPCVQYVAKIVFTAAAASDVMAYAIINCVVTAMILVLCSLLFVSKKFVEFLFAFKKQ